MATSPANTVTRYLLKPDLGRIGYGVTLIHNENDARDFARDVSADYLIQEYVPGPLEFGVFYLRKAGIPQIFSINSKEFPAVTGDGRRSVRALLASDQRLSEFARLFNREQFERVPARGERVPLSVVGSHTLGCVFRDASELRTPEMLAAVDAVVGVPGFNYGRLDVRTASIEAFQRGEFTVIEVNGVESLATNAFDPGYSYAQGLRWFIGPVPPAGRNRRRASGRGDGADALPGIRAPYLPGRAQHQGAGFPAASHGGACGRGLIRLTPAGAAAYFRLAMKRFDCSIALVISAMS